MTTEGSDLLEPAIPDSGGMDNTRSETDSEDGGGRETQMNPIGYEVSQALIFKLLAEAHLCAPTPTPGNLILLKKFCGVCFNFEIA